MDPRPCANRNQPAAEALKPLLDAAWEGGLRECVKATLQTCQRSCIVSYADENLGHIIANATQVLCIDPGFLRGYGLRGWAYARNGDYDRAIADYSEAIRHHADDLTSYYCALRRRVCRQARVRKGRSRLQRGHSPRPQG